MIGNTLNILTFTQLKLFQNNRSAFYLTVESISNLLNQLLFIAINILISLYGDDATEKSLIWCRFRYAAAQVLVLFTSYTLCLAAGDQFFSTNYQLNLRNLCTIRLARWLSGIFVCIWLIHSIVFTTSFNIQPSIGCTISDPIWLRYSTYFFYPVLIGLLPICIASLFNILAFRNVRRIVRRQLPIARRRLDQQMTALVLIRVVMLAVLFSPYAIFRTYSLNTPTAQGQSLQYAVTRLIQAIVLSLYWLNISVSMFHFSHLISIEYFDFIPA
ncbi:unnamed protein product [Adineta ricciae]|uniref:G-protein coupled receptors family 1 profile domain-containing protein n=1 Tax=Adineta ricciae TaxID=249248 RepID=A0A815GLA3_ADIRI|nr:unnamed protein product [Adineta ricciae]